MLNNIVNDHLVCPSQSETGTNYYKEIPLSEILAVNTSRSAAASAAAAAVVATADGSSSPSSSHCFEIRTANVDFYVGDVSPAPKRDSGTGPEVSSVQRGSERRAIGSVNSPHCTG